MLSFLDSLLRTGTDIGPREHRQGSQRGNRTSSTGTCIAPRTSANQEWALADRVSAYPTGKADAERARGEFQRTFARRVLEPELVSEPVRCTAQDRGVEERVQRRASAQQFGIQNPERVCRGTDRGLLHTAVREARDSNAIPCPSLPHPGSNRTGSR